MKILLDTHVLLWWLDDAPELQKLVRSAISDADNVIYISAVTAWEIEIKSALGKLAIPDDWADVVFEEPFRLLSIDWDHALRVRSLPLLHRDPFDRLLVAQALVENLTLATRDATLAEYGVPILKC